VGQGAHLPLGRFALELVDAQTESTWDGLTGKATSGPLNCTVLEQIPIRYEFWFAWSDFYPETDLFAQSDVDPRYAFSSHLRHSRPEKLRLPTQVQASGL
jgi:hypothetical protein